MTGDEIELCLAYVDTELGILRDEERELANRFGRLDYLMSEAGHLMEHNTYVWFRRNAVTGDHSIEPRLEHARASIRSLENLRAELVRERWREMGHDPDEMDLPHGPHAPEQAPESDEPVEPARRKVTIRKHKS